MDPVRVSLRVFAFAAFIGLVYCRGLSALSHVLTFLCGLLFPRVGIAIFSRVKRGTKAEDGSVSSIYGLDHGRLHLKIPPTLWMNMGYWYGAAEELVDKEEEEEEEEEDEWRDRRVIPKTLAGACRNLLDEVLSTAGFKRETQSCEGVKGIRRSKFLIDLGFGCGDQTIYLNGLDEVSEVDKDSWVQFDYYVGITRDTNQCQVAKERVHEYHQTRRTHARSSWETPDIRLYCADAADPGCWSDQLQANMDEAVANTQEHWVLALDTLYHFSPSRWPVIDHMSRNLDASFMAFDLCLSPRASLRHRFMLRAITTLMGAPWANFVTVDQYRDKLVQAGYSEKNITIKDISHHVFEPLADFMVAQDGRLQVVGYGLGPFWVAQCMFAWWARSGIVRGVIVVAKK